MADLPADMNQKLLPRMINTGLGLLFTFGTLVIAIKYLLPRLDPSRSEKERSKERAATLLRRLNLDQTKLELDEYELCIAQDLVDPETMQNSWTDVGGLDDVIQQLKETVIWPLRYAAADGNRASRICRPPKGVLLYGPPGCGKTLLARVTARESGARFINLQASTLLDKWYGESQKRTAALFTLARKLTPCIIFIDEIDAFLRSRSRDDHEATALMKTQFMTFWDGLQAGTDSSGGIVIIGATNRLADIDEAILRRMPARLYVSPPDSVMRSSILRVVLRDENVAQDVWDFIDQLSEKCVSFSGSDLLELCRQAAMIRLRWHYSRLEERQTGTFKSLGTDDDYQRNLENFKITRSDFEAAFAKVLATKRAQAAQSKPQMQAEDNDVAYRLLHLLGTLQNNAASGNRVDSSNDEEFLDSTTGEHNEKSAPNDVSPD